MSEIAKKMNVSSAYLLNKWSGLSAYDDVAALVRLVESLEGRLSRARAKALEEAEEVFVEWGTEPASPTKRSFQERIRALIATPAPATIPAERVREVLARELFGHHHTQRMILRALGVELDAKGEAKDTRQTCTCTGSCKGAAGLGAGWRCTLERKP